MSQNSVAYTNDELMGLPVDALPSRGPVCPKCGNHVPQFVDLSDKDEARLRELIRNDRKVMATRELRAITRCPLSWAKLWVAHSGRTTAPCPYCGKPLKTARAKQCQHCNMDWHDAKHPKRLGKSSKCSALLTTMRRRAINGVLHNFLGTYTSRYSDYDGYWLFGLLVGEVRELKIDLLVQTVETTMSAPVAAAVQLAVKKFRAQMEKAGFSVSCVKEAKLDITKLPDSRRGVVNGRVCAGHDLQFVARAISDYGKTYESRVSVFVAPHDSGVELRSTRHSAPPCPTGS